MSFVGETHGTSASIVNSTVNRVVSFPGGIADGDLVIVYFAYNSNPSHLLFFGTMPSGWTEIDSAGAKVFFTNVARNGSAEILIAQHVYASSDGSSVTFSLTTNGTVSEGVYACVAYRSVDASGMALDWDSANDGAQNDSTTSLSENKVTSANTFGAGAQTLISAWYCTNGSITSAIALGTAPTNAGTERVRATSPTFTGLDSMLLVYDESWASASDYPTRGPATWTATSNQQLFEVVCRLVKIGEIAQGADHWAHAEGSDDMDSWQLVG